MNDRIAHWNGSERVFISGSAVSLERRKLIQAIFHAADLIDWPKARGSAVPAPVLRSVVLYCLALNICSSEEIVEACESDPSVRYLCANYSLEWDVVHDFRKRNLIHISDALANVFESLAAATADPHLRFIARAEAERRIRLAVQADSTVLDL